MIWEFSDAGWMRSMYRLYSIQCIEPFFWIAYVSKVPILKPTNRHLLHTYRYRVLKPAPMTKVIRAASMVPVGKTGTQGDSQLVPKCFSGVVVM